MRAICLGLVLALTACGSVGDTASTSDPAGQNVASAASEGTPAAQTASSECAKKPDFAPVYKDAKIELCTSTGTAPGQQSGTVIYTSAAEPKTVLGWSREQANASGLAQRMLSETMYSAGETTKRSVMILVEPEGSGSRVTVNWGSL